ncbi:MAG: GNAT family N-acetyltransferase [Bacteroidota bacterium]
MSNLRILPYAVEDNEAALSLEEQCVQGKSLSLKFCRQTFHARSEVYDNCRILCAKAGGKLVGIVAATVKVVRLRNEMIRAAYIYDLRVHPDYRNYGLAKRLASAVLADIGQSVDCIYTLIAGQNERAIGLARRSFGAMVVLPLIYAVLPVYKRLRNEEDHRFRNASRVHEMYLKRNRCIEFVPQFDEKKLHGYVASVSLGNLEEGACSIWTNENLLAEQVVTVPVYFRILRVMSTPLRPFLKMPSIPMSDEIVRSWYLFHFYATNQRSARNLIATVNNFAVTHDKKFLYILLQSHDPALVLIRRSGCPVFTFPYLLFAKGQKIPCQSDKVYLDIKDV